MTIIRRDINLNIVESNITDSCIKFSNAVVANKIRESNKQKENDFLNPHGLDSNKNNTSQHTQNKGFDNEK